MITRGLGSGTLVTMGLGGGGIIPVIIKEIARVTSKIIREVTLQSSLAKVANVTSKITRSVTVQSTTDLEQE